MCEPVTLISTGLAVASSAVGTIGAHSRAKAQRSALTQQRANQAEEIAAQADAQAGDRVKAARAERARIRVAAGEAGVGGNSVDAMMFDSFQQQDSDLAIIRKNEFFSQRGSEARYRSGMAAAQGPSALEAGLGIASAGFAGYQTGLQIKDVRNRVATSEGT